MAAQPARPSDEYLEGAIVAEVLGFEPTDIRARAKDGRLFPILPLTTRRFLVRASDRPHLGDVMLRAQWIDVVEGFALGVSQRPDPLLPLDPNAGAEAPASAVEHDGDRREATRRAGRLAVAHAAQSGPSGDTCNPHGDRTIGRRSPNPLLLHAFA